jgi:hypothetical protein
MKASPSSYQICNPRLFEFFGTIQQSIVGEASFAGNFIRYFLAFLSGVTVYHGGDIIPPEMICLSFVAVADLFH